MGEIIPCRGNVYYDAWVLFGKSAAHEGNVVIGQYFDDFFGEIVSLRPHRAAIALVVAGSAFLDALFQAAVQVLVLPAFFPLALVVPLVPIPQPLGHPPRVARDFLILRSPFPPSPPSPPPP